jgi:hypothetical protein
MNDISLIAPPQRFTDSRSDYLNFLRNTSEKAQTVAHILGQFSRLSITPHVLRVFDAGLGDGEIITRLARAAHTQFPTTPFFIAGREISGEDVSMSLHKMVGVFTEHPDTVFAVTNFANETAVSLGANAPKLLEKAVWKEIGLTGNTAHEFQEQIDGLMPALANDWQSTTSEKTGHVIPKQRTVLVFYRKDRQSVLHNIIPKKGHPVGNYHVINASQPYSATSSVSSKAKQVILPLAHALDPTGIMIVTHASGTAPGSEIIKHVWSDYNPYANLNGQDIINAAKAELCSAPQFGKHGHQLHATIDSFSYSMNPLLGNGPLSTQLLPATLSAALYTAQIPPQLISTTSLPTMLEATRAVHVRHNGNVAFANQSMTFTWQPI